jgi:hypothetical protein
VFHVRVRGCVRVRARVCVCVCACVRAGGRGRVSVRGRVCVCVCVFSVTHNFLVLVKRQDVVYDCTWILEML